MLKVGDGLWKTITARGEPISELHYADVLGQQAGFIGMVREHDVTGYYAMRLKIVDGRIVEAETVVNRVSPPPPRREPPRSALVEAQAHPSTPGSSATIRASATSCRSPSGSAAAATATSPTAIGRPCSSTTGSC